MYTYVGLTVRKEYLIFYHVLTQGVVLHAASADASYLQRVFETNRDETTLANRTRHQLLAQPLLRAVETLIATSQSPLWRSRSPQQSRSLRELLIALNERVFLQGFVRMMNDYVKWIKQYESEHEYKMLLDSHFFDEFFKEQMMNTADDIPSMYDWFSVHRKGMLQDILTRTPYINDSGRIWFSPQNEIPSTPSLSTIRLNLLRHTKMSESTDKVVHAVYDYIGSLLPMVSFQDMRTYTHGFLLESWFYVILPMLFALRAQALAFSDYLRAPVVDAPYWIFKLYRLSEQQQASFVNLELSLVDSKRVGSFFPFEHVLYATLLDAFKEKQTRTSGIPFDHSLLLPTDMTLKLRDMFDVVFEDTEE